MSVETAMPFTPIRYRYMPSIKRKGMWTVDELVKKVPKELLKGYENPAKKPMPE